MNILMEILIPLVSTIFDHTVETWHAASILLDAAILSVAGSGVTLAFALDALAYLPEGVLTSVRRWHSSIDDPFANIDNLVTTIAAHQPAWVLPGTLITQLTANRDELQTPINKCRSTAGSAADRMLRNTLLKSTVGLCLLQVRVWAIR
jgi:hypothetical protein